MVKREFTGKRDPAYSLWHRTIGAPYCMIDLDSVEWRADRGIVAFIEVTRFVPDGKFSQADILNRKQFEVMLLDELQRKHKAPAYIVFYTFDLSTFWIYTIENGSPKWLKAVDKNGYTSFIRGL